MPFAIQTVLELTDNLSPGTQIAGRGVDQLVSKLTQAGSVVQKIDGQIGALSANGLKLGQNVSSGSMQALASLARLSPGLVEIAREAAQSRGETARFEAGMKTAAGTIFEVARQIRTMDFGPMVAGMVSVDRASEATAAALARDLKFLAQYDKSLVVIAQQAAVLAGQTKTTTAATAGYMSETALATRSTNSHSVSLDRNTAALAQNERAQGSLTREVAASRTVVQIAIRADQELTSVVERVRGAVDREGRASVVGRDARGRYTSVTKQSTVANDAMNQSIERTIRLRSTEEIATASVERRRQQIMGEIMRDASRPMERTGGVVASRTLVPGGILEPPPRRTPRPRISDASGFTFDLQQYARGVVMAEAADIKHARALGIKVSAMHAARDALHPLNQQARQYALGVELAAAADRVHARSLGMTVAALHQKRTAMMGANQQTASLFLQMTRLVGSLSLVSPAIARAAMPVNSLAMGFEGMSGAGLAAGVGLIGVAASVGILVAALNEARRVATLGEELSKLHERTGLATRDIQALQLGLADLGISQDILATGMKAFNRNLEQNDKVLGNLGVTARTPREALLQVADAFRIMGDSTQRTDAAVVLFGVSGDQWIPVLAKGREHLEALTGQVDRFGITLKGGALIQAERADQAFDDLAKSAQGLRISIGVLALPYLADLAESLREISDGAQNARNWLDKLLPDAVRTKAEAVANALKLITAAEEELQRQRLIQHPFVALGPDLRPQPTEAETKAAAKRAADLAKQAADLASINEQIDRLRKPVDLSSLGLGFASGRLQALDLLRTLGSVEAVLNAIKEAGGGVAVNIGRALSDLRIPPGAVEGLTREMVEAFDDFKVFVTPELRQAPVIEMQRRLQEQLQFPEVLVPAEKPTALPEDVTAGAQIRGVVAQVIDEQRKLATEVLSIANITRDGINALVGGLEQGLLTVFSNLTSKMQTIGSAIKTIWSSVVQQILAGLARIATAMILTGIFKIALAIFSGGASAATNLGGGFIEAGVSPFASAAPVNPVDFGAVSAARAPVATTLRPAVVNPTPVNVQAAAAPNVSVNVPPARAVPEPNVSVNVPRAAEVPRPIVSPNVSVNVPPAQIAPTNVEVNVQPATVTPTPVNMNVDAPVVQVVPTPTPNVVVNVPSPLPIPVAAEVIAPNVSVNVASAPPPRMPTPVVAREVIAAPNISVNVPPIQTPRAPDPIVREIVISAPQVVVAAPEIVVPEVVVSAPEVIVSAPEIVMPVPETVVAAPVPVAVEAPNVAVSVPPARPTPASDVSVNVQRSETPAPPIAAPNVSVTVPPAQVEVAPVNVNVNVPELMVPSPPDVQVNVQPEVFPAPVNVEAPPAPNVNLSVPPAQTIPAPEFAVNVSPPSAVVVPAPETVVDLARFGSVVAAALRDVERPRDTESVERIIERGADRVEHTESSERIELREVETNRVERSELVERFDRLERIFSRLERRDRFERTELTRERITERINRTERIEGRAVVFNAPEIVSPEVRVEAPRVTVAAPSAPDVSVETSAPSVNVTGSAPVVIPAAPVPVPAPVVNVAASVAEFAQIAEPPPIVNIAAPIIEPQRVIVPEVKLVAAPFPPLPAPVVNVAPAAAPVVNFSPAPVNIRPPVVSVDRPVERILRETVRETSEIDRERAVFPRLPDFRPVVEVDQAPVVERRPEAPAAPPHVTPFSESTIRALAATIAAAIRDAADRTAGLEHRFVQRVERAPAIRPDVQPRGPFLFPEPRERGGLRRREIEPRIRPAASQPVTRPRADDSVLARNLAVEARRGRVENARATADLRLQSRWRPGESNLPDVQALLRGAAGVVRSSDAPQGVRAVAREELLAAIHDQKAAVPTVRIEREHRTASPRLSQTTRNPVLMPVVPRVIASRGEARQPAPPRIVQRHPIDRPPSPVRLDVSTLARAARNLVAQRAERPRFAVQSREVPRAPELPGLSRGLHAAVAAFASAVARGSQTFGAALSRPRVRQNLGATPRPQAASLPAVRIERERPAPPRRLFEAARREIPVPRVPQIAPRVAEIRPGPVARRPVDRPANTPRLRLDASPVVRAIDRLRQPVVTPAVRVVRTVAPPRLQAPAGRGVAVPIVRPRALRPEPVTARRDSGDTIARSLSAPIRRAMDRMRPNPKAADRGRVRFDERERQTIERTTERTTVREHKITERDKGADVHVHIHDAWDARDVIAQVRSPRGKLRRAMEDSALLSGRDDG